MKNTKVKILRWPFSQSDTGRDSFLMGGLSIGRKGVLACTGPCHDNSLAPLVQMRGRLKTIATVVTRPTSDPDAPGMRGNSHGQTSH